MLGHHPLFGRSRLPAPQAFVPAQAPHLEGLCRACGWSGSSLGGGQTFSQSYHFRKEEKIHFFFCRCRVSKKLGSGHRMGRAGLLRTDQILFQPAGRRRLLAASDAPWPRPGMAQKTQEGSPGPGIFLGRVKWGRENERGCFQRGFRASGSRTRARRSEWPTHTPLVQNSLRHTVL